MSHLAYVFERFPSFTQTFCVREIMELKRLGVHPVIFSIHDPREEAVRHFPADLFEHVHFLPSGEKLVEEIRRMSDAHQLPQSVVLTLRQWGGRGDKARVYEAAWIGAKLHELDRGVKHAHSHFAGVGARTCWWLRKFYGLSYSFTAHANDIFCKAEDQIPTMSDLFQDASLVVTVSDFSAHLLSAQFPDASARVRRVYNGLDLAPFIAARAKSDRSNTSREILSVGRLIEKKGYDVLIDACALLRDRGLKFRCRIVGEGPLEAELKEQIINLGLQQKVELTGPLPMPEITRLLAEETQVFALACKTEQGGGMDNLPTVLMEAMAASVPCVSTKLAGVPEMVLDGKTGLLCDEKNPTQLADALAALLQNSPRCEQVGEAGLRHAKKHFAKERTARELLRAFAECSAMRFDVSLAWREKLLGALARRMFNSCRQLRHDVTKARDKTFDLVAFMRGT